MGKSRVVRRVGGVLLLLVWAQVATANALPCAICCLLDENKARQEHHGMAMPEHSQIGQGVAGANVVVSQSCGKPQLLAVTFLSPALPLAPVVINTRAQNSPETTASVPSPTPRFDTPPPRA
jgi:hypothetical protein